ncbi:TonB-dependent receptor [Glaciecola sp. 2405UD65-10]|uniref:TonB-dependent receptor n=1 Tax=Glaciecola sp. 2405UD65-10 TaxID=3397244 RepID=UPI003B5A7B5B
MILKLSTLLSCICAVAIVPSSVSANSTKADVDFGIEVIEVTSGKAETFLKTLPNTAYLLSNEHILESNYRNIIDVFKDVPGVLVQKTAHGQGSPYIRGFTGYRNLLLIDGIRLNNAIFRSGPNQYWSTVDSLSVGSLEVLKGPSGVIYGSDGIGGTVNVNTLTPQFDKNGAALYSRLSSAEQSNIFAARYNGVVSSDSAFLAGISRKDFGDLKTAQGTLNNSAYEEYTYDLKWQTRFQDHLFTFAHYGVNQNDVPRTHKTLDGQSFAGTTVGNELVRDHDQNRDLSYVKYQHTNADLKAYDTMSLALSHHLQTESRFRLRSRDRIDTQNTDVRSWGLDLFFVKTFDNDTELLYGLDRYQDNIDSKASNNTIQGPVADDAKYTTTGLFSKLQLPLTTKLNLSLGTRYTQVAAESDKVQDPVSGLRTSLDQSWNKWVFNAEFAYSISTNLFSFASVSQGFRAPNFSDLTRLDSARSNEFEVPSPNLSPEDYVNYEIGLRGGEQGLSYSVSAFYTDIEDQIVLFPTGMVNEDGEFEMSKANASNGYVYGIESAVKYHFTDTLSAHFNTALIYGKSDQYPSSLAEPIEEYISRLAPHSIQAKLNYSPSDKWFVEAELTAVDKADRLSSRDQGDTDRIPPGGTPGYAVINIRAGYTVNDTLQLMASLENITDKNYRIHGSGQNEAGRNLIVALNWRPE